MNKKIDRVRAGAEAAFNDNRWHSESGWLFAAVLIGVVVAICVTIPAFMALSSLKPDDLSKRIDIIYKLGLIGAAAVTFCTVVWRGLITARQANAQLAATDLQREQIQKLAQQIATTEENNLAQLLQKGAELIASDKEAHRAAGVATLQSVATDRNAKFATEAMNLLVDAFAEKFGKGGTKNFLMAIVGALRAAAQLGRRCDRVIALDAAVDRGKGFGLQWSPIEGLQEIGLHGGSTNGNYVNKLLKSSTRYEFLNMEIERGTITVNDRYEGCTFKNVHITQWTKEEFIDHTFMDCDFSGAKISGGNSPSKPEGTGNFFLKGDPPTNSNGIGLPDFVEEREKDEIDF